MRPGGSGIALGSWWSGGPGLAVHSGAAWLTRCAGSPRHAVRSGDAVAAVAALRAWLTGRARPARRSGWPRYATGSRRSSDGRARLTPAARWSGDRLLAELLYLGGQGVPGGVRGTQVMGEDDDLHRKPDHEQQEEQTGDGDQPLRAGRTPLPAPSLVRRLHFATTAHIEITDATRQIRTGMIA